MIISEEVIKWAGISENELLEEVALSLYKKRKLTFGQAAQVAKMNHVEFQFLLGRNKIPVNYDVNDLLEDMETIVKLKK